MAVKQYIGARYIPKISDINEGIHTPEASYEPLTIVFDLNRSSYISIKFVPVGIPLNDPNYWILQGTYNGNIQHLEEEIEALRLALQTETDERIRVDEAINYEVSDLETDIEHTQAELENEAATRREADTTLQNNINAEAQTRGQADNTLQSNINAEAEVRQRVDNDLQANINALAEEIIKSGGTNILYGDILCIGDSYLRGSNDSGELQTSWGDYIGEFTHKRYVIKKFLGGVGFGNVNAKTFATLLEEQAFEMPEEAKRKVTCIIVGGGYNDRSSTAESIAEGIHLFSILAETHFPNATVILAFIPWSCHPDTMDAGQRRRALYRWEQGCIDANVRLISNANMALAVQDYKYMVDGKHPNSTGHKHLASAILGAIHGGAITYSRDHVQLGSDCSIGIENNEVFVNKYSDRWVDNNINGFEITPGTVNFNGSVIARYTSDNPLFKPTALSSSYYSRISVTGVANLPTKYCRFDGYIQFESDGTLSLHAYALNDDKTNWMNSEITRLRLIQGTYKNNLNEF